MNLIKYLRKAGYEFSIKDKDFIFIKDNKSICLSKLEIERYLFIKLLELIEHESKQK